VCSASVESAHLDTIQEGNQSKKVCVSVCARPDKDSLCLRYIVTFVVVPFGLLLPSRISLFKLANKYLLHLPIFFLLLLLLKTQQFFGKTSVTVRYCD
jgi:hypothetical protein